MMIANYIKVALRNIVRHKLYSLINIIGLAVGMACAIIILQWVIFEFSFDRYHEKADRIYRLATDFHFGSMQGKYAVSNHPAGPTLERDYPEVERSVRFYPVWGQPLIRYKEINFAEENMFFADRTVFDVFSFHLLSGDPDTALAEAYSVVVTKKIATKLFGKEDPLGKIIRISSARFPSLYNGSDVKITGVMENVPANSQFKFNILISYETYYRGNEEQRHRWTGNIDNYTFLLLAPNTDPRKLEKKLPALVQTHLEQEIQDVGATFDLFLQPLTRLRLYSKLIAEPSQSGFIEGVIAFIVIAVLILLVASINYMNLATARSTSRAREVGLRKALGADRKSLIIQFTGESIIFSVISLLIALALVELFIPVYISIFPWEIDFKYTYAPSAIAGYFIVSIIIGFISGSYPAFYLSAFQPVATLKGERRTGAGKINFRSLLVIFQFTISIALIFATIVALRQFNHMLNKAMGFDRENVAVVKIVDPSMRQNYESVKAELLRHSGITGVAFISHQPGSSARRNVFQPEGYSIEQMKLMDAVSVDPDFIPVMGIGLSAGRNFLPGETFGNRQSVLINETAMRQFGWSDAVGKTLAELKGGVVPKNIIGVVKDFHQRDLYNKIDPLFLEYDPNRFNYALVKIAPGNIPAALDYLEQQWRVMDSSNTFHCWFLDEGHLWHYRPLKQIGFLYSAFALLTILIACLGLLGLAAFTAEQRKKEIGIRKTLGATVADIFILLSRSFLKWILLANIFAWPLAVWFNNGWLEKIHNRIEIGIDIYIGSGLLALIIALVTVSWQTWKASRGNPIDALRHE